MVATIRQIVSSRMTCWSVANLKSYSNSHTDVSTLKLRQLLTRVKEVVAIDDNMHYKQLRIKTKGRGVELRGGKETKGESIKTKTQYRVRKGQLVVSKIDARNGAFGIADNDEDGAIITSNFWTFEIDTTSINPFYLLAVLVSDEYIQIYQSLSNGSTNRQYMSEELFLNLDIPLSERKIQETTGRKIKNTIKSINQQYEIINQQEKAMSTFISENLGLAVKDAQTKNSLLTLTSDRLSRWDFPFLSKQDNKKAESYVWMSIGALIHSVNSSDEGKSLRITPGDTPKKEFRYIGLADVAKRTCRLMEYEKLKGEQIKSGSFRVPYGYILFGKLRPLLGKCLINTSHYDNVICSTEFLVFQADFNNVNPYYLQYVLTSDIFARQIVDMCAGTIMPRLSLEAFMATSIPVPPLDVQERIVSAMNTKSDNLYKNIKRQKTIERSISTIYKH